MKQRRSLEGPKKLKRRVALWELFSPEKKERIKKNQDWKRLSPFRLNSCAFPTMTTTLKTLMLMPPTKTKTKISFLLLLLPFPFLLLSNQNDFFLFYPFLFLHFSFSSFNFPLPQYLPLPAVDFPLPLICAPNSSQFAPLPLKGPARQDCTEEKEKRGTDKK